MCAFVSGLLNHVRQLLHLSFRMDDMTEPTANQSPCCHDWGRRVQSASHCSYSTNRKLWWPTHQLPIIITLSPFTDAPRTISINMEINTAVQCERYNPFNDMSWTCGSGMLRKRDQVDTIHLPKKNGKHYELNLVLLDFIVSIKVCQTWSKKDIKVITINGETQTCCKVWIQKETSWNWCASSAQEAVSFDLLLETNAIKALSSIFITHTGGLHSSSWSAEFNEWQEAINQKDWQIGFQNTQYLVN